MQHLKKANTTRLKNPAGEILYLTIASKHQNRVSSYRIANQMGQTLEVKQLNGTTATIPIGKLTPGMYYLVLEDKGEVLETRKFVKQ